MLNRVELIGHMGSDPETKRGGTTVTRFSLATTEHTGKGERTEWHKVVCFDRLAETVAEHCQKGHLVHVDGSIQTRSWDHDGAKRYMTEVIARRILFLRRPEGGGERRRPDRDDPPPVDPPADSFNDDDIPF